MSKQLSATWLDDRFEGAVRRFPSYHSVLFEEISNNDWLVKCDNVDLVRLPYSDLFDLCVNSRGNQSVLVESLSNGSREIGGRVVTELSNLDVYIQGLRVICNAFLVADSELQFPNEFQADQWFDDNFLLDVSMSEKRQDDAYFLPSDFIKNYKANIDNLYASGLLGKFCKSVDDRTQHSYFLWFNKHMYKNVLSVDFARRIAIEGISSFTLADVDVLKEIFKLRDKRIEKFIRSAW